MADMELPLVSFVKTRERVEDLVEDADDLCFRSHRSNRTEYIVGDLGGHSSESASVSVGLSNQGEKEEGENGPLRKTAVDRPWDSP